jgi:glycosyltransferase involved in cell wall biosynthesis
VANRALHIGVDGRELVGHATGVGRYLLEVLRAWASDASFAHRVSVVLPSEPNATLRRLGDRIDWHVEASGGSGTWWEQTRLPRALRRLGADVLFAAGYTAPLRRVCPFVVAVYDVSFFAHPEWFRPREGRRRRWLSRLAALRAASVITISEFSAGEIVRWIRIPRPRIHIAAPGAPPPGDLHAKVRAPVVLFVGSLFNRRHIPELLQGFALTLSSVPEARLILVGDNRTSPPVDPLTIANDLGIGSHVSWRRYVSDHELEALYGQARVFAFLSDYEGFAMTPMEAIAMGTPPVLLDTPVSREVYGDAAALVTADPADIARAFVRLLTDRQAHANLMAAGRRRLDDYSWPRTANIVRRALEDAVGPRT